MNLSNQKYLEIAIHRILELLNAYYFQYFDTWYCSRLFLECYLTRCHLRKSQDFL